MMNIGLVEILIVTIIPAIAAAWQARQDTRRGLLRTAGGLRSLAPFSIVLGIVSVAVAAIYFLKTNTLGDLEAAGREMTLEPIGGVPLYIVMLASAFFGTALAVIVIGAIPALSAYALVQRFFPAAATIRPSSEAAGSSKNASKDAGNPYRPPAS